MINTWFTRITEGNGASHENKISEAKSFEFTNYSNMVQLKIKKLCT